MRYVIALVVAVALAVGLTTAAGNHAFTGVKKCSMCHKGAAKGEIFEKWQASKHSKAYALLASQEAKDAYTKLGKTGDPQKDDACLRCHVTGFGVDSVLVVKRDITEGVTCEACHGAGQDYSPMTVMKSESLSVAAGMIEKPVDGCVRCHNADSPTFKAFVFAEKWPLIKHGLPPKN